MASRAHFLPILALGLIVFGCKDAPTQLLVVVDSDLQVPAVLTDVEVRATVTGRAEVVSRFDVTGGSGSACSQLACPLPLSVGVAPESDDASESAAILVRALGPFGELVTRTVRTGFVKGRRLVVPVYLSSSCRAVTCASGSTCDQGACVPEAIDPATLQEAPDGFEPGRVFPPSSRPDAATQVSDGRAQTDADFDGDATETSDSGMPRDASASSDSGADQVVFKLSKQRHNGATHAFMSAQKFMRRI